MADQVYRFTFEHLAIRGVAVQLDSVFKQSTEHADYPASVKQQLGQWLSAAALMAATIKYEGRLTLQLQGQGPMRLLLAQSTNRFGLRGMARVDAEALPDQTDFKSMAGAGRVLINIQNNNQPRPWQGVIDTDYASVSELFEAYFKQSEQLDTGLWLFSHGKRAAGLLLQRMPAEVCDDEDAWPRVVHLASTLTQDEALDLPVPDIVNRLFHEETLRVYEPSQAFFSCEDCTDRIAAMLKQMDLSELQAIANESDSGKIEVTCEFCAKTVSFDPVDLAALGDDVSAPASSSLQ